MARKIFKVTLLFFLILTVLASAAVFWFLSVTKDVKFDESKLASKNATPFVMYDDGTEIVGDDNLDYVNIAGIPKYVKDAFISIEDRRFYSHGGIDVKSFFRAIKNNILSFSAKEGASTISQQLVKNTFLSSEKTVERKMKELKLTLELERRYSKDKILEMYLNTVYFGEGAYGINKAAKTYFGKDVGELDECEGATLAGLVKAPSYYDPKVNPDECLKRRNIVLLKMESENYLDHKTSQKLREYPINLTNSNNEIRLSELYDMITDEATKVLKLSSALQLKGCKIYTSVNKALSEKLSVASDYGLDTNFSSIVVDNESARIIGVSTDVGNIRRCPASAAKPWLIYAPAIEEKIITEATKILDEKTNFNGYIPSNYGDKYYGFTSVKECLSKSLNVPSVKIAEMVGLDKIKLYAEKLNISYENNDLSVAIGNLSGGITLSELLGAYVPFSCGGFYKAPTLIDKIIDENGKTIYKKNDKKIKYISEETAYIIDDMLKEGAKNGTAKLLSKLNFEVYGKTGTNGNKSGNTDAYCIAFTKKYSVGVWLGNVSGKQMPNSISGGTYPTNMAADALELLCNNTSSNKIQMPIGVKNIKIDKKHYEENNEVYISDLPDNECLSFLFLSGTEPTKITENKIMPFIKDYKITYNYGKIKIIIDTDKNVYCKVLDKNNSEIYDSVYGNTVTLDNLNENTKYEFYLLPYSKNGNVIRYGNKIKLPTVITDGKNQKNKIRWWDDLAVIN